MRQFFELTEAGNLRADIRRKLVVSLLLSANIRPAIKFLFLENLLRFPKSVRHAIVTAILKAEPSHHMDLIKEEVRYILDRERQSTTPPEAKPLSEIRWN